MKSSDEIKKGLECCLDHVFCAGEGCPYYKVQSEYCDLMSDALALIQQLKADKDDLLEERELNDYLRDRVKQLEAERDAAMTFLRGIGCDTCRYREVESWEEPCLYCIDHARWQWIGAPKEATP